jgi:hypothetical protein
MSTMGEVRVEGRKHTGPVVVEVEKLIAPLCYDP